MCVSVCSSQSIQSVQALLKVYVLEGKGKGVVVRWWSAGTICRYIWGVGEWWPLIRDIQERMLFVRSSSVICMCYPQLTFSSLGNNTWGSNRM